MQQLTNAEEQLMEHLWKLEKAFMKEMGIKVQVERANGKLADNDKTLAAAAK